MNKLIPLVTAFLFWSCILAAQCTVSINSTTAASCGNPDGSVTIMMTNGQEPYNVNLGWTNLEVFGNGTTVNDLSPGSYEVTVTDAADCNEVLSFTIPVSDIPSVFVDVQNDCNANGCAEVIATGGTAPYTYDWDSAFPGTSINCGLPPGFYQVTVTDANACEAVVTFIIEEINVPFVSIFETPIGCSTAQLTAEVNNGPNAIFNWNTGELSQSITVIESGVYAVTVVDAATGCASTFEYFYSGNNSGYAPNIQNITCAGENDGAILANVPPDFNPTVISWAGPGITDPSALDQTNLSPGTYLLTLEFADGCVEDFGPYVITSPAELTISSAVVNTPSCFGGNDGSIDIAFGGGTAPYTFDWSPAVANTPNINNLSAGTYSLTITDANNCTYYESFELPGPDVIELTITGTPESCLAEGSAEAVASGGVPPYSYTWSNGESSNSITDVVAGIYTVTVSDILGCMATSTYSIASPIDLDVTSTFAGCNVNDGTATVQVTGGATQPTFAWSNGQSTMTAIDLAPDWYSVTVTDETTDCQVHQNVQVIEDTICYVRISGYVYLDDVEQDCQVDATTLPAPYVKVFLSDGQLTFTNPDGYYEFTTDAGTYDLSIEFGSANDALCADPITVDAATWGQAYPDNNFYLKLTENSDIQLKVIKFNARPGFLQDVRICLMNVGAVPRSGTLSYVHPEIQEFISSNPAADAYDMTSQTATWDFVDLPPGAIWIYTPKMLTPIGTDLGTTLEYGFYTDPIGNDLTPENNNIECSIVVTGSYDPNDKAVAPVGVGEEGIISMADSLLSYTIRFQNTGTDTAFTVLLRDTLDTDLIVASVRPGPASHPYSVSVKEGNILEFLFENILLPDSTVNEEASNGFVIFDVFIRDDAPYGTVVENRAGIYFDFNPPIITNTVVNTIQMINALPALEENDIALQLQPNPSQGATQLSYSLEEADWVDISLLSLRGEQLKVIASGERQAAGIQQIKLADLNLAAGVYFIKVETRSGGVGIVKLLRL